MNRLLSPIRLAAAFACAALCAAAPLALRAQPQPGPSAAEILSRAETQARAQNKDILLDFGASWCINCKLYDRFLHDPAMNAILSRHFVFASMDTGERPHDPSHSNTPGGVAFENSIGGQGAGWPFIVVLNASGHSLITSDRPDPSAKNGRTNIGYPVAPQEIDWFIQMISRGAPSISQYNLNRIRAYLQAQAAKIQH